MMLAGADSGPLCQSASVMTAKRELPVGAGPGVTRLVGSSRGVSVGSGSAVGTRVSVTAGGGVGRGAVVPPPSQAASTTPTSASWSKSLTIWKIVPGRTTRDERRRTTDDRLLRRTNDEGRTTLVAGAAVGNGLPLAEGGHGQC